MSESLGAQTWNTPVRPNLLQRSSSTTSRFALAIHPLSYVPWAMHDLRPICLARSEEPNHFYVNYSHLRQVQDKPRSVILELLFQFRDLLRLELTTQADHGLSALGSHFDLHVPLTLIQAPASYTYNMLRANADSAALPCVCDAQDCSIFHRPDL